MKYRLIEIENLRKSQVFISPEAHKTEKIKYEKPHKETDKKQKGISFKR